MKGAKMGEKVKSVKTCPNYANRPSWEVSKQTPTKNGMPYVADVLPVTPEPSDEELRRLAEILVEAFDRQTQQMIADEIHPA